MGIPFILILVVSFLSPSQGSAQRPSAGGIVTAPSFPVRIAAVSGAPYSAEMLTDFPGAVVTYRSSDSGDILQAIGRLDVPGRYASPRWQRLLVFRDAAGRIRTEEFFELGKKTLRNVVERISIDDVVANCRYVLDTDSRVAHRFALEITDAPDPAALWATADPASYKSLGTKIIEGIQVEGRKIAGAGYQYIDAPRVSIAVRPPGAGATVEEWYSKELKLMVYSRMKDPSGVHTMQLRKIRRAEPDPGLLQVPAGYRVVDEHGPFTIEIKTR